MLFFSSGIEEYPERIENELESQFIVHANRLNYYEVTGADNRIILTGKYMEAIWTLPAKT